MEKLRRLKFKELAKQGEVIQIKTLAEHNINILVISTSEIKISVLVAEEFTELALRALHTAYGLDES